MSASFELLADALLSNANLLAFSFAASFKLPATAPPPLPSVTTLQTKESRPMPLSHTLTFTMPLELRRISPKEV
ncbi:hypothetical protein CBOM_06328 [Ceraceosorus bombacis]|uniref:Uncharacterized protein n=1 Tax=Ceraceosorus bombacis TaxID=401625 RepID=A0A0P1BT40_9BASI|nr:hypothetical protein CBOM_06328 [Ceraceosorus bombacis]